MPLLLALAACHPAAPVGRPNIVILVSDDQDYEHFSFAGHPLSRTPAIDAMAEGGVLFTHAFAPMSRCRPAQAALLSGQWPHQSGVYYNYGSDHIDPDTCIANVLREAGYVAFGEGKFWEFDPRLMGFENYTIRNYETFARLGQEHLFEFLDELDRDQPFFLWWAPQLPHVPHNPPERLLELFDPAEIPIPAWFDGDVAEYRSAERSSLAMEAWLDEEIENLRRKLDQLGELDDTLFLFLIDNGYANGLPSKGTAYDKGLRTPAILSWPAGLGEPQELGPLVSFVDLYATLIDYAGADLPEGCQGRSLRPLIEGQAFEPRSELFGAIYLQSPTDGEARPERDVFGLWARTERWKYVLYLQDVREADDDRLRIQANLCAYPERDRGDEDLFDLAADPHELHDLSDRSELAGEMRELREGVLAWWRETGGRPLSLP